MAWVCWMVSIIFIWTYVGSKYWENLFLNHLRSHAVLSRVAFKAHFYFWVTLMIWKLVLILVASFFCMLMAVLSFSPTKTRRWLRRNLVALVTSCHCTCGKLSMSSLVRKLKKVSNFALKSAQKSTKYLGIETDQYVSGKRLPNMSSIKLVQGLNFSIDRVNIRILYQNCCKLLILHSFNACLITLHVLGFLASIQNTNKNFKLLKTK